MNGPVFIKVRAPHAKFFVFLTWNGYANRHRKRAAQFVNAEQAQALIDSAIPDNPGWEWRIVPADFTRWEHSKQ